MRLFFGGLFDFKFGRGLVHLAFELITGLLEFSQTLTESAGELGKLFRAEEQNHNHENKDGFRPTGHTKGDWKIHFKTSYNGFPGLQRNLKNLQSRQWAGGATSRPLAQKSRLHRRDQSWSPGRCRSGRQRLACI